MPKTKNRVSKLPSTLGEALKSFDLKVLMKWIERHDKPLHKQLVDKSEDAQMEWMCYTIINRTDLLGHGCIDKAFQWLKDHHYMNGRMF